MAIDWNADVGDLLKQLFSAEGGEKQERPSGNETIGIALLWPLLLVLLAGNFLWLLYLPSEQEITRQQSRVEQIPQLRLNKVELQVLAKRNRQAIDEANIQVEALHRMMFAHREIDQLYRKIHEWARVNRIEVLTLKKLDVAPVVEETTPRNGGTAQPAAHSSAPADPLFYRIRLKLRAHGEFLDYLKLREALLGFGKMIHVNEEKIRSLRVSSGRSEGGDRYLDEGKVVIEMVLSAYQSDASSRGSAR